MITVSDGVAAGRRQDDSGPALAERIAGLGFEVSAQVVPDDASAIQGAVRDAAGSAALVVLTGGTGLTPRDVTPQALRDVLDYEVPGLGELMRAEGRRSTIFAALSRSVAGVIGRSLVLAMPGSPRGALESLAAVEPLLDHALETLGDAHEHPVDTGANAAATARPALPDETA